MRLRTRIQIEMKHYVERLRKTMPKAMPKRGLACTMKTFKNFKAVSRTQSVIQQANNSLTGKKRQRQNFVFKLLSKNKITVYKPPPLISAWN